MLAESPAASRERGGTGAAGSRRLGARFGSWRIGVLAVCLALASGVAGCGGRSHSGVAAKPATSAPANAAQGANTVRAPVLRPVMLPRATTARIQGSGSSGGTRPAG